jgi:hypothetical protein
VAKDNVEDKSGREAWSFEAEGNIGDKIRRVRHDLLLPTIDKVTLEFVRLLGVCNVHCHHWFLAV